MGLESINFLFYSNKPIKEILEGSSKIELLENKKYVYRKEDSFWIDIEIQSDVCISIRITLSNPISSIFVALDDLFNFLFSFNGKLKSLNSKETFVEYNIITKEKIFDIYLQRRKIFEDMYGNYNAAISSEEFYKRRRY
ncbi:hypothetical protein [Epilithonimonas hungarica]|uniref:Uncharacterized protein n=1 Tax=Epilithonimonas hungarica TaxID=454006 RepID=A0A1G7W1U4_9FLAO|nr:hypothetical protein [Epilithonimonas hungarica]SDG66002.1 hypothetical protein SAMN05421825_3782 [Epilithonimonas hungarica]